ncbi:hypothetical protein [Streptomyces atratus]|uniref:hypothetical protein n=1 Tax=Streptomyces atratus TaxID=1893 RepID=UPI0036535597
MSRNSSSGLLRDAIGLREVLFQSITAMAPAAAVAASIPAGAAIAEFVPALLTASGIPAFDFVSELSAPVSYGGPVLGVWMLIGIVVLTVLLRRHPERVAQTGRIHLDDAPEPAGEPETGAVQR